MPAFEWTVRPLPAWPHVDTPTRRGPGTFRASWDQVLTDLAGEVALLGGDEVVIGLVIDPAKLTLRGRVRADAVPAHPGVVMEVATDGDVLVFATDTCERWQHNVRSISLGLEALRAVDRYGIGTGRQQYRGFAKALTAGTNAEGAHDRGRAPWDILAELAAVHLVQASPSGELRSAYRTALRYWHPDNASTGDRAQFDRLQAVAAELGLR